MFDPRGTRFAHTRARLHLLACLAVPLLSVACDGSPTGSDTGADDEPPAVLTEGVRSYGYRVVAEYPHDPNAFTQGLVLDRGELFEGTGLRGESDLRRVDLESGATLQERELAGHLFGEGVTVVGDRIVQLTWTSRTGFVYDRETFAREADFAYETEGWGITHDGEQLIMSDGTPTLTFRDPSTFETTGTVEVLDEGEPVPRLNELEYIEGHVFANVWLTDRIAVIDPATGEVDAWIDLEGLLPEEDRAGADVLNGIAFEPEAGRLFVTGKLWPTLFEIELVPE